MALVFPSNPNVNDTYTVNGRTYVWNGTTWRTIKAPVPDVLPTLSVDNDFSVGGVLHVDSDNNEIGIGTAAPSHQLHLTQDLGVDGNLIVGGTATVPTPTAGSNNTNVATTAFVQTAVSNLVDSAPATLDTLNELAAALGDDANFATTITNALSLKLDSSSYSASDVLSKLLTVDGASSGLDADLLDGNHASAFATSVHTHSNYVSTTYNSSLNGDSRNSRGVTRLYRRDNNSDYSVQTYWTGSRWRLYGYQGDSNHADTHVGYADSAGNADTTDGLHVHGGRNNEANKIVRTDGNGYIQAGWINTPSGNHSGTITRITASDDNYLRYVTPAHFRSQVTDGVYAAASHSHYISQWNAGIGLNYPGATVGGGSPNQIGFRWASPFVNCTVDNVISAGCANFSDRRIKTDIIDSNVGISAVNMLRPVTYRPLDIVGFDQETGEPEIGEGDAGSPLYGFIADVVQNIIPSAVRGEGIELKSIDSVQLLAVVVKALQEIDSRLALLEAV